MTEITCCNCGLTFAVPDNWNAQRRKDHKDFYCPNGHSQSYRGLTELERKARDLDAELLRERRQRESAEQRAAGRALYEGAYVDPACEDRVVGWKAPAEPNADKCDRCTVNKLRCVHLSEYGDCGPGLGWPLFVLRPALRASTREPAEASLGYVRSDRSLVKRRLSATKGVVTKLRRKYEPEKAS